jgi:DNA modification methylase
MLKDPEFRKIEGFPIGEDDAILALSDPPYYTACPNPFLTEIVEKWRSERAALRDELGLPSDEPVGSKYIVRENMPIKNYHREPFAADVSEGKNDPIYNAHSYHTKVPHKAIMRYILHYTDPGDVVFDGFCGTGMTGIAAQLCGDKKTVESLGYSIKDGIVHDENNKPITRFGTRKAVLNDLSPAATFIGYNYTTPIDVRGFEREAKKILKEIEKDCSWMYETNHTDGIKARINYTVWSEVFSCPNCGCEIVFSLEAFDKEIGHVKDEFSCPKCSVNLKKEDLDLIFITKFDSQTGSTIKEPKRIPTLINYSVGKTKYEKEPDDFDFDILQRIESLDYPQEVPSLKLPDTQMARVGRMKTAGVTQFRHFFLTRQAHALARLWHIARNNNDKRMRGFLLFFVEQAVWGMSVLNRYQPIMHGRLGGSQVNRALSGVFYVASQISEVSPWYNLGGKLGRLVKAFQQKQKFANSCLTGTQNLGDSNSFLPNSIDYIFTDPPFGENIYYSDLNILVETWHGVRTAPTTEAIIDRVKGKGFQNYQDNMLNCFSTYFRVLKPGHWITVEFHNSKNSVWNAIQESLQQAGFIVADVRTLDKVQGSFQQVINAGAVKQDLVISAYKPTTEFEKRFLIEAGNEQGAWDFIREHLEQLPLPNVKEGVIQLLQERFPYLLYDRMVAFHLQRGLTIPLSAPEFYQGLSQRFLERESMVFTAAQSAAYDKLRLQAERVEQLALFVTDESSARQWLRQELEREPQTYGDIQPKFVQQLHQSKYEDLPELKVILEQSFVKDEKGLWCVPDPDNAAHLEQLRLTALLKEFNEYLKSNGRLKVFRSEAIRAGFGHAWRERDYDVIVEIAERIPESVLQEDQQLLMYYHNASLRQSSQPRQENLL